MSDDFAQQYVKDIANYGIGCSCRWWRHAPDEGPPTSECLYHGLLRERMLDRLRALCWEIEKLPAGEQQTKVSGMAGDLCFAIQQNRLWK